MRRDVFLLEVLVFLRFILNDVVMHSLQNVCTQGRSTG